VSRASGTTPGSPSPTGSPSATLDDATARALGAVLAAEQAAVYAYGVVGGQVSDDLRDAAATALQQHAARRDLVAARLSASGRRPAPAAAAYALPFPVTSPRTARALAAHVESAVAAADADLVAASPAAARVEAARWLAQSALAAHSWGAPATAFPGLPERSSTS
jgi:hypothetical protein